MILWDDKTAQEATGGQAKAPFQAMGLSIDTRSIEKGNMFIALKDQRDGHDFVADALAKGAAAALVSYIPEGVAEDAPLLLVGDVLSALEDMARFARARTHAKVIGVTGSVGKTSTKEMLRAALSGQGKIHAAERSFNNHWGVPLTLARMPEDTDFAIIEIGMNHAEEIRPLARLANLDVAIITTVAAVHIEAFASVAEIALAKAEIFDGVSDAGTVIFNMDIETLDVLEAEAAKRDFQILRFGQNEKADYKMLSTHSKGSVTTSQAQINGQNIVFKFQAAGQHFAMNALAVLAASQAAGADLAQTTLDLANWTAPEGRGARHLITADIGQIELIDESYNANPTSMAAALDVLSTSEGAKATSRKIAVLGDMLELGEDEMEMHGGLAQLPVMGSLDQVHTVGPRMRALHANLPIEIRGAWYESAQDMVREIKKLLDDGDIVMVKGSNGSRVGLVASAIKEMAKE